MKLPVGLGFIDKVKRVNCNFDLAYHCSSKVLYFANLKKNHARYRIHQVVHLTSFLPRCLFSSKSRTCCNSITNVYVMEYQLIHVRKFESLQQ